MAKQHSLLTIQLFDGGYMHAYVMFTNRTQVENVLYFMISKIEEAGLPSFGMSLETFLDPSGVKKVREIVGRRVPGAAELLKKRTKFHCTVWAVESTDDDNEELMRIH